MIKATRSFSREDGLADGTGPECCGFVDAKGVRERVCSMSRGRGAGQLTCGHARDVRGSLSIRKLRRPRVGREARVSACEGSSPGRDPPARDRFVLPVLRVRPGVKVSVSGQSREFPEASWLGGTRVGFPGLEQVFWRLRVREGTGLGHC